MNQLYGGSSLTSWPRGSHRSVSMRALKGTSSDNKQEANGLFTKHLLQHVSKRGQDINVLFPAVCKSVWETSKGQEHGTLERSRLLSLAGKDRVTVMFASSNDVQMSMSKTQQNSRKIVP